MRKRKTILNIFAGIGGQLITQILAFIVRTIFIYTLGREYLGINGLFTNILSLLSLAELGVGTAITYYLYKPLAEKDFKKISAYMKFYRTVYNFIGSSILILGLFLIPYLNLFIKDMPQIDNLNLIYVLFLINTAVSYFFSYYTTLLVADQKQYKTVLSIQVVSILRSILQIYILFFYRNYILYLIVMIVCTILNNVAIAKIAKKEYKEIFQYNSEKLSKAELLDLRRYISATFLHKIGSIVVFNTDNLLISSFIGVAYVGITSNYYLILQMISTFVGQIFNGMVASIGNLNSEDNLDNSYIFYKRLDLFSYFIYTIICVCVINVINPFIQLWVGDSFLMTGNITILIVLNFYLTGLRKPNLIFIDTMGLQWITRKKPIIEAFVNLFTSIFLLKLFGLIGVFLGTFVSTIFCSFFYEPIVLYKHGFKIEIYQILPRYIIYFSIAILCVIVSNFAISYFSLSGIFGIIANSLLSCILTTIILLCFFSRSSELHYYFNLIRVMLKKGK